MSAAARARADRQKRRPPRAAVQIDAIGLVDDLLARIPENLHRLLLAELERRDRVTAGLERGCIVCGCSETRACRGGCVWASENVCSRCIK